MAKKKKGGGGLSMTVDLYSVQPRELSGEILDVSDAGVSIRHRLRGKRKHQVELFAHSALSYFSGAPGEEGVVVTKPVRQHVDTYEGTVEMADGHWTVTQEDGSVIKFDPAMAEIAAEEEVDDAPAKKSGGKKDKVKPKGKKAKSKDDDE